MHDKANVALVLEQAYMSQLQTLNQRLAAARTTFSDQEKRITELEARCVENNMLSFKWMERQDGD